MSNRLRLCLWAIPKARRPRKNGKNWKNLFAGNISTGKSKENLKMRHRQGKVGVYLLFLIVGLLVGAMAGTEFVKWLYRKQNASSLNASAADQTASGIQPIKPSTDQSAVSISRENAIVEATKMVSPSVVGIVVTQVQLVRHPYGSDEFFDFFFGPELMPRVKEVERMGSGFVFSKEGYILTNFHVVEGAQKLFVTFSDGRQLEGKIIGVDPQT